MFKDLRTADGKRKQDAEYKKWSDGIKISKQKRAKLSAKLWVKLPWQPITSCPFADYEYKEIFVTDGKKVCIAKVSKRFGTPMRCIKAPELAMTDHGAAFVGGEYEEIKAPKWWFEWELEDTNGSMNYAGGEETGRDEVPFISTHWLPMLPGLED